MIFSPLQVLSRLEKIQQWNEKAHQKVLVQSEIIQEASRFDMKNVHFLFASTPQDYQIIGIMAVERQNPSHGMCFFIETSQKEYLYSPDVVFPFHLLLDFHRKPKQQRTNIQNFTKIFPLQVLKDSIQSKGLGAGQWHPPALFEVATSIGIHRYAWNLYTYQGGPPIQHKSSRCFCKDACSSYQGWLFGKGYTSCKIYTPQETAKVGKDCVPGEYESNQRRGVSWKRCGRYTDKTKGASIQEQMIHHIENDYNKIQSWTIAGYSDGASLAILCASHIAMVLGPSRIDHVFLFGSPRIGNKHFQEFYNKTLRLQDKTLRFEILSKKNQGV